MKCLGAIESSTKPYAASKASVGGRIRGTDGGGSDTIGAAVEVHAGKD